LYGPLDDEVTVNITHVDVLAVNPAKPHSLKDTYLPTIKQSARTFSVSGSAAVIDRDERIPQELRQLATRPLDDSTDEYLLSGLSEKQMNLTIYTVIYN